MQDDSSLLNPGIKHKRLPTGGLSECTTSCAGYNLAVAPSRIEFLEPWVEFGSGEADAFLSELTRELSPGHPLYAVELKALGHLELPTTFCSPRQMSVLSKYT